MSTAPSQTDWPSPARCSLPGTRRWAWDPRIVAALAPADPRPKVLCAMGSSGTKEAFLAAARAVGGNPDDPWNAVILASPAVCSLDEVAAQVVPRPGLVITDEFVPAPAVNLLVDAVVSHGGQGTVQTALASGTPIVGMAMQAEQQINLDHVVSRGAGIRIPARQWRTPAIRKALNTVLEQPSYRGQAQELASAVRARDGRSVAAARMWRYLRTLPPA